MSKDPSKSQDEAASVDPKRKKPMVRAGVAVGIGSAAIVAALLYAGRNKSGGRGGKG